MGLLLIGPMLFSAIGILSGSAQLGWLISIPESKNRNHDYFLIDKSLLETN